MTYVQEGQRFTITLDEEPIECKVLTVNFMPHGGIEYDYYCLDILLEPLELEKEKHGIGEIQVTHRRDSPDTALVLRRNDDGEGVYEATLVAEYPRPQQLKQ